MVKIKKSTADKARQLSSDGSLLLLCSRHSRARVRIAAALERAVVGMQVASASGVAPVYAAMPTLPTKLGRAVDRADCGVTFAHRHHQVALLISSTRSLLLQDPALVEARHRDRAKQIQTWEVHLQLRPTLPSLD